MWRLQSNAKLNMCIRKTTTTIKKTYPVQMQAAQAAPTPFQSVCTKDSRAAANSSLTLTLTLAALQ